MPVQQNCLKTQTRFCVRVPQIYIVISRQYTFVGCS